MCGIAGVWGTENEALVRAMLDRLAHRGPDGRGVVSFPGTGSIGSVRLAIMDPAGGGQPLFSEDGSLALVANSEIYNYPALRDQLAARHQLATGSDSEAAIHLFEDHATGALARLDGMFAIALAHSGGLLLARDPIGIKPLYYSWNGRLGSRLRLRFASELKALADAPDPVRVLPPGGLFDTQSGPASFATIPLPDLLPPDADALGARIRQTLRACVESHLMSDVPLGVFLSGGLDSSIVAALMRPRTAEMHSFSVGAEGSEDLAMARIVADALGTVHHEGTFTVADIARELPAIVRHLESYDRHMVTHAIPNWFCAKLASRTVKVALMGEGADEIFAGYHYFQRYSDPEVLRRELHRTVTDLHQTNLQRVDRMAMAHGVECRVPYVTPAMTALALAIPVQLKVRDVRGELFGKWILRHAFSGMLPDEIIWGSKRNFGDGSGTAFMLDDAIASAAGAFDFTAHKKRHRRDRLKRREEVWSHKLLLDEFGDNRAILGHVARWSELRARLDGEPPRDARRPWWMRLTGR